MLPAGLETFIATYGDISIFGFIFLSEIGIPLNIPNEIILVFAGAQVASGNLRYLTVFATALAADVLGAMIFYLIFRTWGHNILFEHAGFFHLKREKLVTFEERFLRRVFLTVFLGRLAPYLRAYTSAAAGLFEVPLRDFLPALLSSSVVWVTGFISLGVLVGHKWEHVVSFYDEWKWWLAVLLVLFLAWRISLLFRVRNTAGGGNNGAS